MENVATLFLPISIESCSAIQFAQQFMYLKLLSRGAFSGQDSPVNYNGNNGFHLLQKTLQTGRPKVHQHLR